MGAQAPIRLSHRSCEFANMHRKSAEMERARGNRPGGAA